MDFAFPWDATTVATYPSMFIIQCLLFCLKLFGIEERKCYKKVNNIVHSRQGRAWQALEAR